MSVPQNFEGQSVIVTGGTRGLGRGFVTDFLERGARVLATYRSNEEAAESLREECAKFDGKLTLHRFDVADSPAVENFWTECESIAPDGIQVLVSNSGIRRDSLCATMKDEDWNAVLDTNLTGAFLMAKHAVLNMMRQRYGRILFVTSPAWRHGFEGQTNYGASKAGLVGMARSLSKEVAKRKITVNCISPGFIDTELLSDLPDDLRDSYKKSVPQKRFGTVEEVAYAVRTLAAREASYITGTTLEVSGGL